MSDMVKLMLERNKRRINQPEEIVGFTIEFGLLTPALLRHREWLENRARVPNPYSIPFSDMPVVS